MPAGAVPTLVLRPRYYADKLVEHVESSRVHIRTSVARETEEQRTLNQSKKDFLHAALKKADRRNKAAMRASLISSLAYHSVLRGWYAGRCLLWNSDDGDTVVDVLNWDPMTVYFDRGPNGLRWACRVTYQTYSDIIADHPNLGRRLTEEEMQSNDMLRVFDYYDDTYNAVFTDNVEIKSMTRHGAPSIPIYLGFVGGEDSDSYYEYTEWGHSMIHMGESCYAAARYLFPKFDTIMSSMQNFVARADQQSYAVQSQGGEKSLPFNPFEEGKEFQLTTDETIIPIPLAQMAQETGQLLSQMDNDLQLATLPHSAYGVAPGVQISGYAINTLESQRRGKVQVFANGVRDAIQQICDKLAEQYGTGLYQPIRIPGQQDAIASYMMVQADEVEIMLQPDLPGDTAAKFTTAQIARDSSGGPPLVSDDWIRANILEIQDVDGMDEQINTQHAERLLPTAMQMTLGLAAESQGKPELAQEYLIQYQIERMKQHLELMLLKMQLSQLGGSPDQLGGPGGGPGAGPGQGPGIGEPSLGQGPGGSVRGVNGTISPQSQLGVAQQPPAFDQAGPLRAAGAPRNTGGAGPLGGLG